MSTMTSCVSSISSFFGFGAVSMGAVYEDDIEQLKRSHAQFAKKEDFQPAGLFGGMSDQGAVPSAFKNDSDIVDAEVTFLPHVGTTRVELRVNNPDGSNTLLASVDNGNLETGEKSLEDKIREAVSATGELTAASPMANAMANAKKNHH